MRTILTTIALVVVLATPAQAQDLRSPDARDQTSSAATAGDLRSADARIAGRAGWIEVERSIAPGDGGGIDLPPVAIASIPLLAFAALGMRAMERRRRLA